VKTASLLGRRAACAVKRDDVPRSHSHFDCRARYHARIFTVRNPDGRVLYGLPGGVRAGDDSRRKLDRPFRSACDAGHDGSWIGIIYGFDGARWKAASRLSFTGVIPSFVIVRMAMGICAAPTYPAIARMNANWMPVSVRARVWGWVACGAGIGGACSPLFFSRVSASWGWRGAFCVAAGASATLGLIWFRFVRDYPAEDTSGTAAICRRPPLHGKNCSRIAI